MRRNCIFRPPGGRSTCADSGPAHAEAGRGRYWGSGFYFGLGGWGYPYYPYYSGYPYYGYDPYYSTYDPYASGGAYSAPPPPAQQSYGYPPQDQGQPGPPPQYQPQYPPQMQQQPQMPPQASSGNNQGQNFYLIAFNDHSIQAATAYKVDGDQLHWITREGQEMQAPLSTVDVRFSIQINRDRHVDFRIP